MSDQTSTATTELLREVENLLRLAREVKVGGTRRMDFATAVGRTERAMKALKEGDRRMCNDTSCEAQDFPHDPHEGPWDSGSTTPEAGPE